MLMGVSKGKAFVFYCRRTSAISPTPLKGVAILFGSLVCVRAHSQIVLAHAILKGVHDQLVHSINKARGVCSERRRKRARQQLS